MRKGATKFDIPKEILTVVKTLQKAGFEAFIVGGCVRDLVRGMKPKDWDVATSARPDEIQALFPKTFYENEYGTVGVVNEGVSDETLGTVEVTPYRKEASYSDSRHPDKVTFGATLEEDLSRRDFTMNALAYDPVNDRLVDEFGGQEDIQSGTIKAVGEAEKRFEEDALRMLRAVRFAAEFDFAVSRETSDAVRKSAERITRIAAERIGDEFRRIIMSPHPSKGLELAREVGLLSHIVPELEWGVDVDQNQAHSYTVAEHLIRTLQGAADKDFPLDVRLAALLHDIGKPKTRAWDDKKNDWSFHAHEVVGARIAKKILQRLRFSSAIIDKVSMLVRWHMFFSDPDVVTPAAVRRLLGRVGTENIWDLMNLRVADRIGTGRPKEQPYRLRKFKAMIEEVLRDPISVGMLNIDGSRLMEVTHETPGPRIGWILHALLEEVLDDPSLNTPEYLEKKAQALVKLSDDELKALGEKGIEKKEAEESEEIGEIRGKYHVR